MNISESFKIAVKAIKANWMRSLLTMLGIIIGISSVIMIVGAGTGARDYIVSLIEDMGSNAVMVSVPATAPGCAGALPPESRPLWRPWKTAAALSEVSGLPLVLLRYVHSAARSRPHRQKSRNTADPGGNYIHSPAGCPQVHARRAFLSLSASSPSCPPSLNILICPYMPFGSFHPVANLSAPACAARIACTRRSCRLDQRLASARPASVVSGR